MKNKYDGTPDLFSSVQSEKQIEFNIKMAEQEYCPACGEVFVPPEEAVLCPDCTAENFTGVKLAWKFERDEL